jgi:hypothetical protein
MAVREAELHAVLAELRSLRELHFASSSSVGGLEAESGRGDSGGREKGRAEEAAGGWSSPSLGNMRTSSLLTLSPSQSTASLERGRGPGGNGQGRVEGRPKGGGGEMTTSPSESVASAPTALRGLRGRAVGIAARASTGGDRDQGLQTATDRGMSSLVAAILSGYGSSADSHRRSGSREQVKLPVSVMAEPPTSASVAPKGVSNASAVAGNSNAGLTRQRDKRMCVPLLSPKL